MNLEIITRTNATGTRSFNLGIIVSVHGGVIDIRFEARLPPIHSIIYTGEDDQVVLEVLAQLDHNTVRCMALTPTQGLARGMTADRKSVV